MAKLTPTASYVRAYGKNPYESAASLSLVLMIVLMAIGFSVLLTQFYIQNSYVSVQELEVAQYNVDVKITSSHHYLRHGADAMAAIKCAENNGIFRAISEKDSKRLHLFCLDTDGSEYVIIISQIKKSVDRFRNATSEFVTSFKSDISIDQYITNEVIKKQFAVEVRLRFSAGELFFMVP